jgi:integrase
MSEILNAARPELIPWLCIAGFAGLRTAEIQRLEWKNVDLAEKVIEVPASKSKTASRRLAPVTDNLFAWLQPYSNMHGRVTSFENMAKQLDWLVRDINEQRKEDGQAADFKWKHNGLRHSFVSYRISQIKDVAQVALEAGNSPTVIHTNYRQLVSPSEAEKWFAISPAAEEGIIPFERAQN